jgi:hypothetical protein
LRSFLEGGKSGRGCGGGAGFVSSCFSFSSSLIIVSPPLTPQTQAPAIPGCLYLPSTIFKTFYKPLQFFYIGLLPGSACRYL